MTRKDFLKQEAEKYINSTLIPAIKNKYSEDLEIASQVNSIGFLYSVYRLSAFEVIARLSAILECGTYQEIINFESKED